MEKKDTGFLGEQRAAELLAEKGYVLLERNWKSGKLEIDIITQKQGILVFCEVKTRATREYGDPSEFVTPKQRKGIIRAANAYILEKEPEHNDVRFDIISIFFFGEGMEIDHIEDAFYPMVNEIKI